MNEFIKQWYTSTFPTDELGIEINPTATFQGLSKNISNVYYYVDVGDSLLRERVFSELADRMNIDYDVIYTEWLGLK